MTQTMQLGKVADQSFVGRVRTTLARRTEGRGVALLTVILIGVAFFEPLVFTAYQVSLGRIALIGIVALGLTAVILMGELDLSVASTLALSGVVMALIPDIWVGILAALATGLVVGLINAFFVAVVGINSFIATLGSLFALRGIAFVRSDEAPVSLENKDAGIAFGMPLVGAHHPAHHHLHSGVHCHSAFCVPREKRTGVLRSRWKQAGRLRRRNSGEAQNIHRLHDFGLCVRARGRH